MRSMGITPTKELLREALEQVDEDARRILGVRGGQAFRLPDVVPKTPFGSFSTKKRAFYLLADIGEQLLAGQTEQAMGIVAQSLRWVTMSLA